MNVKEKREIFISNIQSTYKRNKKRFTVVLSLLVLFVIGLHVSNFFKKRDPTKLRSEMLDKCMEFIDKEMDRILKIETRPKQNRAFREIKTNLPIKPIRMSLTTAVFLYTHTSTPVVLKRIIWNKNNGLNEDEMCTMLKGKSKYLLNALMSTRSTRLVPSKNDYTKREKQTLIWIFFEYLDVKINDNHVNGNEDVIRKIMRDALKGLKYLHDNNYAHLDIKIANIMGERNKKGEVSYKLIDFGYTQYFSEKMAIIPRKNYGTYPFKAPEVIKKSIHGVKSDIWALGATAWYLSLGNILFYDSDGNKDDSAYASFIENKRHLKNPHKFVFRRETTPELRDFIQLAMQIDWKLRPSADQLLEHPFITKDKLTYTLNDDYSLYDTKSSSSY